MRLFAILISLSLLVSLTARAETPSVEPDVHHGHDHTHHHDHDHGFGIEAEALDEEALKKANPKLLAEILHAVHEALEVGDHDAKGVSGLAENVVAGFNIKRMGINGYRYYQAFGKHGALKGLGPEVMLLLAISHTAETTLGLWGPPLAAKLGAARLVQLGIGVLGGATATPFVEPFDALFILAYAKVPGMRPAIHLATVGITGLARAGVRYSGLEALTNWLVQREDRVDYLIRLAESEPGTRLTLFEGERKGEDVAELRFVSRETKKPVLTLTIRSPKGATPYVEAIDFDPREKAALGELSSHPLLKQLGWNARDMVRQLLEHDAQGRLEHFAEKDIFKGVTDEPDHMHVGLAPGAVGLGPRRWLRFWGNSSAVARAGGGAGCGSLRTLARNEVAAP